MVCFRDVYNQLNENLHPAPLPMERWFDLLEQKGWTKLGEGSFGIVFGHPQKNYVIKLYEYDPYYDIFLNFAEKNQKNPHIVKMRKTIYRGEYARGYVNAVMLEKLKPLADRRIFKIIFEFFNALKELNLNDAPTESILSEVKIILGQKRESLARMGKGDAKFIRRRMINMNKVSSLLDILNRKQPKLIETLIDLAKFVEKNGAEGGGFDMHSENVMIRPSTGEIVITDPIA